MKIIISAVSKRQREDQQKDTLIKYNGFTISSEKLKNVKRRKAFREFHDVSSTACKVSYKILRFSEV